MFKFSFLLLFLFTVLISNSFSHPRFALRSGSRCIDCHVNPTGGEMRNSRGWSAGKNYLPMWKSNEDFEMSNKLNENIQIGLDFRGNLLMKNDSSSTRLDFQRMTGSVYTNIDLSEDINIYARYDFIWQVWEAYGVAKILPGGGYIKGGSFIPNFGIRLDDHTAYTRGGDMGIVTNTGGRPNRGLIYEPRYVEDGIEAGFYLFDVALLTASVGNSRAPRVFATDPTYTASLQIQPDIGEGFGLFFGGSYANFKGERLNANFQTVNPNINMYGGFAGIGIGDFTLMGEFDIADNFIADNAKTNVMMIEAAYRLIKGAEAVVRYDRFDTNQDVSDDEYSRIVIGLDLFPYSFIEVLPQYRIQMEKPSVSNNSALVQIHLYY